MATRLLIFDFLMVEQRTSQTLDEYWFSFNHKRSTVLFSSPASAREPPDLFHRICNCALRDVVNHLDLADLAWQHEMHHTILRLLVGFEPGENLACIHLHFRQAAQTE